MRSKSNKPAADKKAISTNNKKSVNKTKAETIRQRDIYYTTYPVGCDILEDDQINVSVSIKTDMPARFNNYTVGENGHNVFMGQIYSGDILITDIYDTIMRGDLVMLKKHGEERIQLMQFLKVCYGDNETYYVFGESWKHGEYKKIKIDFDVLAILEKVVRHISLRTADCFPLPAGELNN